MSWAEYNKKFYQEPNDILCKENKWLEQIIYNLDIKDKYCLDFGCGVGSWIPFYLAKGARLTGVDISAEAIQHCEASYPSGKFYRLHKNEILPFQDDSFDLVMATWVMQELCESDELEKYLHEISRILKQHGYFIVVENVYPDPGARKLLARTGIGDIFSNGGDMPSRLRFFPMNTMSGFMESWGFSRRSNSAEGWSFFESYEKTQ
jgi:SAM-dependent methyltransferase